MPARDRSKPMSVCLILVNVSFFRLTQQDKTYIILDKNYPIGKR